MFEVQRLVSRMFEHVFCFCFCGAFDLWMLMYAFVGFHDFWFVDFQLSYLFEYDVNAVSEYIPNEL